MRTAGWAHWMIAGRNWRQANEIVIARRRSRRLAKSSTCGRLGSGPDRLRRTGRDAHLHLHAKMVRGKSDKGAVKRDSVARIRDNRNGDKVDVADAAACRIEINPAGAWQIDLRPCMGRPVSRADRRLPPIFQRNCEVPGRKSRSETERAGGLDHQHGEVATTPMAQPERLHR